ncbi:MAG TPA: choline dehydrogenase [Candidatus Acidoferrum sp.]|nr:choline dehydrogenase [Candidatus Acidoferrum sp.]
MAERTAYDYVIVGAGSAGCVLAYRLTADPSVRVLLLEAGGRDTHPLIHIPIGLGKIWERRLFDWGYDTEPEPRLDNRRIEAMRGKVLGGSSSINVMAYVRGHRGDYGRWADHGARGWSYADVLPYFKRCESWEKGENTWRGGSGPLGVIDSRNRDPLFDAWLVAAQEADWPFTQDYNGKEQEGFGVGQWTIRAGRRCSAAVAFLRPAMRRPNLTVETGALATRVLLEGTRAVGIEYARSGRVQQARAAREVLLSGGVFNSPQLLMLSGIGDAEHLREVGIEPRVPLAGVGRNLQDHLSVDVHHLRQGRGPFHAEMRLDRLVVDMARAYLFGTGPGTVLPSRLHAFLKTRRELPVPDIQFLFRGAPTRAHPWFPGVRPAYEDSFGIRPVMLHPESRGMLRLRSNDPTAPVRIIQNFLATDKDVRTIREGVKLARDIARRKGLDPFRGREVSPGPDCRSDAEIDAFVRRTAITAHHPCATCRMGGDEDAVLDPELRVRGVDGLRVVDASAMPDLVSGNINACVLMIAEKASDLLLGRPPLPPIAIA